MQAFLRKSFIVSGLVLASAERADLLVDFSDLDVGSELTLLKTPALCSTAPRSRPSTPRRRPI